LLLKSVQIKDGPKRSQPIAIHSPLLLFVDMHTPKLKEGERAEDNGGGETNTNPVACGQAIKAVSKKKSITITYAATQWGICHGACLPASFRFRANRIAQALLGWQKKHKEKSDITTEVEGSL
jgi:hypothetical protein